MIEVRDLCKRYPITEREETLKGALSSLGRKRAMGECLALDHISFQAKEGELIGIIGSNGAGKSTLLKLLSRVAYPTSGSITLRGRTGALLEVGAGFHPELTGRENIYLSGAILGMRRSATRRMFDAIVEFSEIEAFLDTPIKKYSSGMFLRLAFSVIAHLDSEILIVDEVLSIGDAAFQMKCLAKMLEVAESGRTLFFVSHHEELLRKLCTRLIWLEKGVLREDGPVEKVLSAYALTTR